MQLWGRLGPVWGWWHLGGGGAVGDIVTTSPPHFGGALGGVEGGGLWGDAVPALRDPQGNPDCLERLEATATP